VKNFANSKNIILKIGKRIRKRRISMGWTMMDLSYEAETDYRQIGRIERGETNFTIGTLVNICGVLGI
jgi:transcriptional regulator with XRE-family HTH domain